ncbi:predicted protein, partial [Scheffersomyces stipitis CBS 6054]
MPSFANVYWSSDLSTGLSRLNEQSNRSIQQLHELRKLVFSYMNYYHSNSEFLNKLSIDSYPMDSEFRPYDRFNFSLRHQVPGRVPSVVMSAQPSSSEVSIENKTEEIYVDTAFQLYVKNMSEESHSLITLASVIDREVLEKVTVFLKKHEPEVKESLSELYDIYHDYVATYDKVEKTKKEYEEVLRLKEFADASQQERRKVEESTQNSKSSTPMKAVEEAVEEESHSPANSLESEYKFPLRIGSVEIDSLRSLSKLLADLISSVDVVKRKIPIPGYRNELFSSDQLCSQLLRTRPRGIDPTRLKLEKFGQALIDYKFIVGTGFLGNRKFKSEGMWFEWSELALYISTYDPEQELETIKSAHTTASAKSSTSSSPSQSQGTSIQQSKFMNEVASTTSKRFNGLLNTVKSSLMKTNYDENLAAVKENYLELYMELQELKYIYDRELINKSHFLENFERHKIELIYKSLAKLSEIIYNFSLNSTNRLHVMAKDYIDRVNKPENYVRDFDKLLSDFSSGIYFPTSALGVKPTSVNNNFQNLEFQFNLFKDIPLQLKYSQVSNEDEQLLSTGSIPVFFYRSMENLESTASSHEKLAQLWQNPLDHEYWELKKTILNKIAVFGITDRSSLNEVKVEENIIDSVLSVLKDQSVDAVVNFIKNWLLEISDSLIPCVVYDSITSVYKLGTNDTTKRIKELERILGSIPRSNLASLIFILEHIAMSFDLTTITSYELSDELQEDLESLSEDIDKVKEVSNKLNAMDAIGSIPFVHLIFRPSVSKNASGFKPPLDIYIDLLSDLLSVRVRMALFKVLVSNEKNYLLKLKNTKGGFQVKKALPGIPLPSIPPESPPTPSKTVSNGDSKSGLAPENFTLRPFRTRSTPVPSPSSSP